MEGIDKVLSGYGIRKQSWGGVILIISYLLRVPGIVPIAGKMGRKGIHPLFSKIPQPRRWARCENQCLQDSVRITEQRYAESYDKRMWWGVQQGKPRNSLIEQPMSFVMRSLCSQLFPAFFCGRPKDILIHLLKEIIINMERDRNHS